MKTIMVAAALALSLMTGVAEAQSGMTLDTFVTQANRVPQNPTALLRRDARRLMGEAKTAFKQVGDETRAARAAGRPTSRCPPERTSVDVQQFLRFLNGIPQARRARMSVADGVRAWMIDRYPCAS